MLNVKQSLVAVAVGLAMAGVVQPASAVTVGSFDSGNCYPFNCNDSGTSLGESIDYQQIYDASAVGSITFDQITFFSWPYVAPFAVLSGDYDITFGTTTSAVGSGYPISMSNTATFFNGALGGPIGSTYSITGTPYSYNPTDGNLVMEIVVTNQANVPNGSGNSYFWADYTASDTTRAYLLTGYGTYSGTGALVTEFTSAVPEPESYAMLLAGLGLLGLVTRRRKQKETA